MFFVQSGYPINPFIPPESEIFRPPKSAVKNLKRKDFLGKAKVNKNIDKSSKNITLSEVIRTRGREGILLLRHFLKAYKGGV